MKRRVNVGAWWDKKARANAKKYIALASWKTEENFDQSGFVDARRILADILLPKDCVTLEIGIGIGRIARHTAKSFGELYAVDVSSEMVQRARERLNDVSNCQVFENNGNDLSIFPNENFDFVYSVYVFQHLTREVFRNYLSEIYRVLRPNGLLKFQIFERTKFWKLFPVFWFRNVRHLHLIFWRDPPDRDPWVARSYSRRDIFELMRRFEAVEIKNPTGREGDLWIVCRKPSGNTPVGNPWNASSSKRGTPS
jgi:ubiquinone/menaquinone biosynthesis C-methylase UbiE